MLALIGPQWLTMAGQDGRPLLADPGDWVRREIATALAAGRPVVPVLLENAPRLTQQDLPADIAPLACAEHRYLRSSDLAADLQMLREDLVKLIPGLRPGPQPAPAGHISAEAVRNRGYIAGVRIDDLRAPHGTLPGIVGSVSARAHDNENEGVVVGTHVGKWDRLGQSDRSAERDAPVVVLCAALDSEYEAIGEHIPGPVVEEEDRGTLFAITALPTVHATWKVVLVLTERDNTPAALQVERAIARYQPQVVLFVGVAGGRRDARIGDVVAASVIYNYEAGLDTDAGLLTRIKTLPSSFRLVQQAHAVVREKRWMLRVKPTPPAAPLTAFVRPLAAGTKVVAGGASQTGRLIEANGGDAQAVEMEGFGVLYAAYANKKVDALVIRGISDLLGGKNKIADRSAQPAAARHAAAFAFEILHRLKPDVLQPHTGERPATTGSVVQSGSGTKVANTGLVQGDFTVGGTLREAQDSTGTSPDKYRD